MKYLFLLFINMLCMPVISQELIFDQNGKLIAINDFHKIVVRVINKAGLTNEELAHNTKIVADKVSAVQSILSDSNNSLNKFYSAVLGDSLDAWHTYYTDFNTNFLDTAFANTDTIYEMNKSGGNVTLYKYDRLNSFIINYYNNALNQPANRRIKKLTTKELQEISYYLQEKSAKADTFLKMFKDMGDGFSADTIHRIDSFHLSIVDSEIYDSLVALIRLPWFKEWLWIRSGQLKLNPLDFTSSDFIKINPEHDVTKAKIYDEYIDSLLARYIRLDTFGRHIEDFKAILKQKGNGREVFSFQEKLDKLKAANEESLNKLLATKKLLNDVKLPLGKDVHNYSADGETDYNINNDKFLKTALLPDENKLIAVHNLPKGAIAGLEETDSAIKDRSQFQEFTDTLIGSFAALIEAYTALSPSLPSVSGTVKSSNFTTINSQNKNIIVDKSDVSDATEFKSGKSIKRYLQEGDTYDPIAIDGIDLERDKMLEKSFGLTSIDDSLNYFFEEYNRELEKRKKEVGDQLVIDQLVINQFIEIFVNSTLPPGPLAAKTNNDAVYHSKILKTKSTNESIKKEVEVFVVNKNSADTAVLDKFTYKTGKTYRFQLSAGLAYTFGNYFHTKVEEKNGAIVVTHDNEPLRFVTGVNIHLGKGLFLQNNSLRPEKGNELGRFSAFLGIGFPKPLERIYTGVAYDIVPGFKVSAGTHFYRNDFYKIQNNRIAEQRTRYQFGGMYISIGIDPISLTKVLDIF